MFYNLLSRTVSTSTTHLTLLFLLQLAFSPPSTAQDETVDVNSLLNRVNTAYGGIEKLESINTVTYEFAGYRISRHQSRRTQPPWDRVPVRSFIAIDYANNWVVRDGVGSYPGGLVFPGRTVIGPDGHISLDTERRTYHRGQAMSGIDGYKSQTARYLTPILVRQMNKHEERLEYQGLMSVNGTEYHHLQLGQTGVLVDTVTYLVYASLSSRHDMAINASIDTMLLYPEHRMVDGIPFPASLLGYLPEENTYTTDYRLTRLKLDQDIRPLMTIPDNFIAGANPHMGYGNDGELQVTKLAEGVFLAGDNNTNILYVEFEDHFVAMETGGMAWYAEQVYSAMQVHMNDKPLRYVIPTHYHDDHAVGIRFYTTIGATILTTPGKAGYLRTLLEVAETQNLADKVRFEWLGPSGRTLKGPNTELQILVYTNAPHSEEMLLGYLPRQKSVFSADLFIGWGGERGSNQGAGYGFRHLMTWLDQNLEGGSDQVETFIPVHGRPYPRKLINNMMKRPRTFITLPGNVEVDADNWFINYGLFDETISGRRDIFFD